MSSQVEKIDEDAIKYLGEAINLLCDALNDKLFGSEPPKAIMDLGFGNTLMQITARFTAFELTNYYLKHQEVSPKHQEEWIEVFVGNLRLFADDIVKAHIKKQH